MMDAADKRLALALGFLAQIVFGFLALNALLDAAMIYSEDDAFKLALASCVAVILAQSFGMRALDRPTPLWIVGAFALWLASLALGLASFLSLP